MGNFYKKSGGHGGKRGFGASSGGWNRGGRDGGRPTLHRATCSACERSCEVPFKPNGRKSIFCSNCFQNEGGGNSRPSHRSNFDRPKRFDGPPARDHQRLAPSNEEVVRQLKKLNETMETLLEVFLNVSGEDHDDGSEEEMNFEDLDFEENI